LAAPVGPRRFVRDELALADVLLGLKLVQLLKAALQS
jgi:hypothetical protein